MNTFYPIKGFEESYAINKLGQILNTKKNKLKTLTFDKKGNIVKVSLSKNGGRKSFAVHTLVFNQFNYDIFEEKRRHFIKHVDGNPINCNLDNLYITYSVREPKPKQEKIKRDKVKKEPKKKELKPKKEEVKIEKIYTKTYCDKGHYTKNNELLYQTILSKGMGKVSKSLQVELYKIAEGVWTKLTKNLYYSEFKFDMLNDAYLQLHRKALKFDELRFENALAYFTEIAKRALAHSYNQNVYKTERYMTMGKNRFISIDKTYNL